MDPQLSGSLQPKERFRHAVRKVIALHRGANFWSRREAGAEPGVDPRRASADAEFGGLKQECVIELADYSAVRSSFRRMTNHALVDLMKNPAASAREPWVKVRWINIGGMSWDVMKALSIKYNLHPLALEDVFHAHSRARSKVDYYAQHLFLRILCHELREPGQESNSLRAGFPPAYLPTLIETHTASTVDESLPSRNLAPDEGHIQDAALQALKSDERVNVDVAPMFIFLFRDGTVITIHSTPSLATTEPITTRVRQFDTVLRTSADASFLVQSLLSLVTDKALEIITAYQDKIKKFERNIMGALTTDTVRNLHVLSTDLILRRRTLAPIRTVVYGLRRYDADRAAALVDASTNGVPVAGFMSHKSLTYLADVQDQIEYVLSQLDTIGGIGKNLVDYTFNMTAYKMNEVMRRLMLATVIFLPLTLLTGYFGMNFSLFYIKRPGHSDKIFWIIAIPVMVIVLPLFLGPDIQRMWNHVQKQMLTKKAVKTLNKTVPYRRPV
ncbi:hypothetical protein K438DRAFT_1994987 [Mycena galopus ATCC 62051]|nr:hypothetical protein K438DRAFT_1994987 [Mycena galopus ATCC 62051]